MKKIKQLLARRRLRRMTYDEAMGVLRHLAFTGSEDHRTMLLAVERAIVAAEDGPSRRHAERWAAPLRAGRTIGTATAKITVLDGIPIEPYADNRNTNPGDDVVAQIEKIFAEGNDER